MRVKNWDEQLPVCPSFDCSQVKVCILLCFYKYVAMVTSFGSVVFTWCTPCLGFRVIMHYSIASVQVIAIWAFKSIFWCYNLHRIALLLHFFDHFYARSEQVDLDSQSKHEWQLTNRDSTKYTCSTELCNVYEYLKITDTWAYIILRVRFIKCVMYTCSSIRNRFSLQTYPSVNN